MFEHILIPLDGSSLAECVLPHGLAMAGALGARATILQVVEQPKAAGRTRAIDPLEWHYSEAQAGAYLQDVGERLRQAGLPTAQALLQGDAAERVIDHAQAEGADLILLSSHGRSGLSGWNVSSVVQKILARAYISILLIPAYHPSTTAISTLRYERILVPLDGSQRAECVLPVAGALAARHDSQVILTHVVRRPELPRRAPPSRDDQELAHALTERNRIEATRYLEEVRARLSLPAEARLSAEVRPPTEVRLLVEDHVAAALQQVALEVKADLVVLSAHGYSGETRWPYGSLATSFILYGNTPLLIVQDLPRQAIEPTAAELAAREFGHH
jgi:nucleotide-binding universal stress UspA family protein